MRALRIHGYGGPEVMRLENVPTPAAGAGQLLVRVRAASVNPIDWKIRRGMLAAIFPLTFPRTLGRDCAGEADGKLIAGVVDPRGEGTHAEYALLPATATAPVPAGLDAAAAASLCVAGLSAWIPLVETARVASGMRVLIHGGAGGVGSLAIQVARGLGATVVTTSTQRDYCTQLGAQQVIDYRTESFADAGPFDVVLDTLGGDAHVRSLKALRSGGVLVALAAAPIPAHAPRPDVRVEKPQIQATRERLERIFDSAVKGKLKPQVTQIFPLEHAAEAYAASEGGHGKGKIVLQIS
ncbi:MAG TPA: NADP-dependent oxidoreductase [Burkholderiales bacterium]|nr:NADP-dependent oxidoreductase [Burkholderiales bacterium]